MNSSYVVIAGAVAAASLLLVALSLKWSLPARPTRSLGFAAASVAAILGLAMAAADISGWLLFALTAVTAPVCFAASILWLFYRDPERSDPGDAKAIVSPADGQVIYIRQLEAGEPLRSEKNGALITLDELAATPLGAEPLWQIGISMVFTDVHVNRAPIAGKVVAVHHKPGKFLSLRLDHAVNVNERQTLYIEGVDGLRAALVQIASRLVRQIEAYVQPGQAIARGHRVGMIRFGSQVDILLPVAKVRSVRVSEGQRLTAGETIIAYSA